MKLLISILMFPVIILLSLAGLCWGFVVICLSHTDFFQAETAQAHTVKGCLYTAIGCGLPLSVATAAAGAVLVVLSFIFKSWTRAILAGGAAFLAIWMWLYFLNITYPL